MPYFAEWTSTDIERASRLTAQAVCAAAALLCVLMAVRLAWVALPRGVDLSLEPLPVAPVEATSAPVTLSKWHLFGSAGPSLNDLARSAPATQLQLNLRGTIAEADPREGMAVIADPTSGERAYRVGDTLPGGHPGCGLPGPGGSPARRRPGDPGIAVRPAFRATAGGYALGDTVTGWHSAGAGASDFIAAGGAGRSGAGIRAAADVPGGGRFLQDFATAQP
ncbi:type II secretion system protein N [Tahibacter amnicola]|uniref:Type II secretion system protein GspC N-terminal domain-containing protein n=1 Tax=Tahibacter amnicola TaxID=2976241 RepID=A0ABY6BGE4_9GAMM|nr:type II secretion system protein N [Tahibacter amnicola]UXI69094.1 hypothetical protein N4264_05440 [Tahibacter amnicola]